MRRDLLLLLLLWIAMHLAHAADAPRGMAEDLQALLTQGVCPRFLLPQECHHLRSLIPRATPAEREAILAVYWQILHERAQACRCELESSPVVDAPEP